MSDPLVLSDLVKWSAKYSMPGSLTASVEFTNQRLQYGSDLLWTTVTVQAENTVITDLPNSAAFSGTVTWINGVIQSIDDGCQIADKDFKASIASFFSVLVNKPINTHYYDTTAATVLLDILQVYCGVPVALFSISVSASPSIVGIVQGADVWSECFKLAQCCRSDMFVQVGGILKIATWKDHNSIVNWALPREAIISVTRTRGVEKGPSRIRIRGRHVSKYDCGPRLMSTNPVNEPSSVSKDKCYRNGLGEPSSQIVLKNLGGSENDLTNASYILNGDLKFDVMTSSDIKDATATIKTVPKEDSYLEAATDSKVFYKVLGRNSKGQLENQTTDLKAHKDHLTIHDKALAKLAGLPLGVLSIANKDPHMGGESGDRDRLEMVINDPALQANFGLITEEVDNSYISDGYTAFIIGIRKVQEYLMGRNKYKLKTAYLPALQINDVITFIVTDTDQALTGRVVDINVEYDAAASSISMDLEVECFTELAGRTYVSGNLLVYSELCGINQKNWVSGGGVYALSGYFGFESGASVYQPLLLNTNVVFTVTVDVILPITSSGTFRVRDSSSNTSASRSSSGTLTLSYTPVSAASNLIFESVSGEWFMTNPKLITSIIT